MGKLRQGKPLRSKPGLLLSVWGREDKSSMRGKAEEVEQMV